ncbi:MAG: hypothetical protein ACAI38_05240 [Myxococcota bacterium]
MSTGPISTGFTYYDGRTYEVPPTLLRRTDASGRESDQSYASRLLQAYENAGDGRDRLAIRAALAHEVGLPADFRPVPGRRPDNPGALLRYQRVINPEAGRLVPDDIQQEYARMPNATLLTTHFVGADGRVYEFGRGARRARPDSDPLMHAFRTVQSSYDRLDRGTDLRAYAAGLERAGAPVHERQQARDQVETYESALIHASIISAMFGFSRARSTVGAHPPAPEIVAARPSGPQASLSPNNRHGFHGLPWARPMQGHTAKGVRIYVHNGPPTDLNVLVREAQRWLGPGFRQVRPGQFESHGGMRRFRLMDGDIAGKHGDLGPHVHFEYLGTNQRSNLHVRINWP